MTKTDLKTIESGRSTDEKSLRRQIKDAIVCQHLPPSFKVTENVITEMFHTTRTVARSLIEQLTAQNFLISVSPRVTRVAPLTVFSIKENFVLRKMLMPELTAMSIRHVDFEAATSLNNIISDSRVDPGNDSEVLELIRKNREYNLTLSANVKYQLPIAWAYVLEDMAMRVYWLYVKQHGELPFNPRGHETLIEAMRDDDSERVRTIVREILEQNEERILTAVFSNDQFYSQDLKI